MVVQHSCHQCLRLWYPLSHVVTSFALGKNIIAPQATWVFVVSGVPQFALTGEEWEKASAEWVEMLLLYWATAKWNEYFVERAAFSSAADSSPSKWSSCTSASFPPSSPYPPFSSSPYPSTPSSTPSVSTPPPSNFSSELFVRSRSHYSYFLFWSILEKFCCNIVSRSFTRVQ